MIANTFEPSDLRQGYGWQPSSLYSEALIALCKGIRVARRAQSYQWRGEPRSHIPYRRRIRLPRIFWVLSAPRKSGINWSINSK